MLVFRICVGCGETYKLDHTELHPNGFDMCSACIKEGDDMTKALDFGYKMDEFFLGGGKISGIQNR